MVDASRVYSFGVVHPEGVKRQPLSLDPKIAKLEEPDFVHRVLFDYFEMT